MPSAWAVAVSAGGTCTSGCWVGAQPSLGEKAANALISGCKPLQACYSDRQGIEANLSTLRGAAKKHRRGAELPWLRVDGDLVPIQDTERRLV